jgi:exodeoxyribonuclease VII large subunit
MIDVTHFAIAGEREILTVSQLNQSARLLLENHFGHLWVEGELSNVARPSSGHIYFTLKDEQAQIRCALFRTRNQRLNFTPDNGQHVQLQGQVSLYEVRGDYQLIVEHMELAGDGALQRAFELLKRRLAEQGLFAAEHKQPLPSLPKQIGVITSATGAAIKDILTTLQRRFPAIPVVVYPCEVQGKQAAPQIASAIAYANRHAVCDVLILARGGGSLEDLWGFNEESVARAIFESHLPIVSGVGHEVDITIADFVADIRAATPTAAAETVVPDWRDWHAQLTQYYQQLARTMSRLLSQRQQLVQQYQRRLRHPRDHVLQLSQRLDHLEQQLLTRFQAMVYRADKRLQQLKHRLYQRQPRHVLQQYRQQLTWLDQQLRQRIKRHIDSRQQDLQILAQQLHTLSPLATLTRGYAIAFNQDKQAIRQGADVKVGESITVRLPQAEIEATVELIKQLD